MAPIRKKNSSKSSTSALACAGRQWKAGDLVLAKVRGFPAWPATVSEPERWGYSKDWKKVLVYFFGTKQIAFCNPADIEPFTEEKKQTLVKRHGRGADFTRAVREIIDSYDKSKVQEVVDSVKSNHEDLTNYLTSRVSNNVMLTNPAHSSSATGNLQLKSDVSLEEMNDPGNSAEDSRGLTNVDSSNKIEGFIQEQPPSHLGRKRTKVAKPQGTATLKRSPFVQKFVTPSSKGNFCSSNSFSRFNEGLGSSDIGQEVDFLTCSLGNYDSENDAVDKSTPNLYEHSSVAPTWMNQCLDSTVGHLVDDIPCNKPVFTKNVTVTKKRRNAKRRRMTDMVAESEKSDGQNCCDVEGSKLLEYLSEVPSVPSAKHYSEYGDANLPFIKRARARMVHTSFVEELNHKSMCTVEIPNIRSETSPCRSRGISSLHFNDVVSVGEETSERRGGSHGTDLPSLTCHERSSKSDNLESNCERRRRCSLFDDEAFLPPSKRFNRALEAMSAITAECSATCTGGSLTEVNAVKTDGGCRNDMGEEDDQLGVQVLPPNVNSPKSENSDQCFFEIGVCNKQLLISNDSSSQICNDNLTESTSSVDIPESCRLSPEIHVTDVIDHEEEKKIFDPKVTSTNEFINNIELNCESVEIGENHFTEYESPKDAERSSPRLVDGVVGLSPECSTFPSPVEDANSCAVIATCTGRSSTGANVVNDCPMLNAIVTNGGYRSDMEAEGDQISFQVYSPNVNSPKSKSSGQCSFEPDVCNKQLLISRDSSSEFCDDNLTECTRCADITQACSLSLEIHVTDAIHRCFEEEKKMLDHKVNSGNELVNDLEFLGGYWNDVEEEDNQLGVLVLSPNVNFSKSKNSDHCSFDIDVCNKQLLISKDSCSQLCDDNLTEFTSSIDIPEACKLSPEIHVTDASHCCFEEEKKTFDRKVTFGNEFVTDIELNHGGCRNDMEEEDDQLGVRVLSPNINTPKSKNSDQCSFEAKDSSSQLCDDNLTESTSSADIPEACRLSPEIHVTDVTHPYFEEEKKTFDHKMTSGNEFVNDIELKPGAYVNGVEQDDQLGVRVLSPKVYSPQSKNSDQCSFEADVCNKQLLISRDSSNQLCDDNLTESTSSADIAEACRLSPEIHVADATHRCLEEEKKTFDHKVISGNETVNHELNRESAEFQEEHFIEYESPKDDKRSSPLPPVDEVAGLSPGSSTIPSPAPNSNACGVIGMSKSPLDEAIQYIVVKEVDDVSRLNSPSLKQTAASESDSRSLSCSSLTSPEVLYCNASHTQRAAYSPDGKHSHPQATCSSDSTNFLQNNDHLSLSQHLVERRVVLSEDAVDISDSKRNTKLEPVIKWKSADSNGILRSFEAELEIITRANDSIGRATGTAINCAVFGIASEVVEVVASNVEKECGLHRKIDLFFLVDSITQSSLRLKGHPGCVYPSLIQAELPRLLQAAAPLGNEGQENRQQCLKVLRLWLDRKILPDSVILNHIRELETLEDSSTESYSRRSSVSEGPHNDTVRGTESMLVDEYGSNSSLQLVGLCIPKILKKEESDSDGDGFDAVTPENNSEGHADDEGATLPQSKMHRCILEDVEGELEMEDVAPPAEDTYDQSEQSTMPCVHEDTESSLPTSSPPPTIPSGQSELQCDILAPPRVNGVVNTSKNNERDVPGSSSISRFPSRSPVRPRSHRAEHGRSHNKAYHGRMPHQHMPHHLPQFSGICRGGPRFFQPHLFHGMEYAGLCGEYDWMRSYYEMWDRWRFSAMEDRVHTGQACHARNMYEDQVRGQGRFRNQGWGSDRRMGRRSFVTGFTGDAFPLSARAPVSRRPR